MKHGFQSVSASFSRYIPPGPSRFATRTKSTKHGHEKAPETCRNPGGWWHPATKKHGKIHEKIVRNGHILAKFWQNFMGISWEYPKIHVLGIFRQNNIKKTAIGMSKRWNNGENMWKQTQVMTGVCCVPGLRQEDIRFKINSWWGSLNSNDSLQDFLGPKSAKSIYMSTPPTIPYVPVAIKGLMSICCCHSTVHASGIEVLVVLDHFLKIICMTKNWLGYLSASLYIISDIVLIAGKTTHDLRFLFSSYTYIYVLRMLKK